MRMLNKDIAIVIAPRSVAEVLQMLEDKTNVTWLHSPDEEYYDCKPTCYYPNYLSAKYLHFDTERFGEDAFSMMTWCGNARSIIDRSDIYTVDNFIKTFFGDYEDELVASEFEVSDLM